MFVILWEFEVKQEERVRFAMVYGPEGPWVRLFASDAHYRETRLLSDPFRDGIYWTLDFWDSEADYRNFLESRKNEYQELDRVTDGLTLRERHLGSYVTAESSK